MVQGGRGKNKRPPWEHDDENSRMITMTPEVQLPIQAGLRSTLSGVDGVSFRKDAALPREQSTRNHEVKINERSHALPPGDPYTPPAAAEKRTTHWSKVRLTR